MDIILNETISHVIFVTFFVVYLLLTLYVIYNELKYSDNKFESTIWILAAILIPIFLPILYMLIRKRHLNKTLV